MLIKRMPNLGCSRNRKPRWLSEEIFTAQGYETQHTHPCLVISNDIQNRIGKRIIVAPLTSKITKPIKISDNFNALNALFALSSPWLTLLFKHSLGPREFLLMLKFTYYHLKYDQCRIYFLDLSHFTLNFSDKKHEKIWNRVTTAFSEIL